MSSSDSGSGSFSSSEAIIAHFDEAAGVLEEGGFSVGTHAWRSVTQALLEETIDQISFWGVGDEADHAKALLRLTIDWSHHAVTVDGGDSVMLPLRDGSIHLYQVRRAAEAFLRAFVQRELRATMRCRYRDIYHDKSDELNRRYGWRPGRRVKWDNADGYETESRYHAAVAIGVFFAE